MDALQSTLNNERGVAMLAVMIILVLMTALGIAALTITSMENTSAGYARSGEAGVQAAESCVETAVNVIGTVIDMGSIPAGLTHVGSPGPGQGPIPSAQAAGLAAEISLADYNNADQPIGAAAQPDLVINVPQVAPQYRVVGDIDKQFRKLVGESSNPDMDIHFRVTCVSQHLTTGTMSTVQAEYLCIKSNQDTTCKRLPI